MAGLEGDSGATVAWVAHPVRRQPRRGVVVGALIVSVAVVLGFWMRSGFWGAFAGGILFLSLEGFFLPARYRLEPEGLTIGKPFSSGRHEWSEYRRVYADRHGLTLSPYRRRTVLEPYRSARLLFDGGDPVAIRRAVRAFCPEAEWIEEKDTGGGKAPREDATDRPG